MQNAITVQSKIDKLPNNPNYPNPPATCLPVETWSWDFPENVLATWLLEACKQCPMQNITELHTHHSALLLYIDAVSNHPHACNIVKISIGVQRC